MKRRKGGHGPRPGRIARAAIFGAVVCAGALVSRFPVNVAAQQPSPAASAQPSAAPLTEPGAVFTRYCVTCHNQRLRTAGLTLDTIDSTKPSEHADVFEKVIMKLRAGAMPPPGLPRPDAAVSQALVRRLEGELDRSWAANPNPGRIGGVHRINRTGYKNAVRDLFALDVDVDSQLPGDETADGSFDNFADVLSISTAHLERYLSVARQVSRLAVGLPPVNPSVDNFRINLRVLQDDQESEDLPFGSRGGIAVPYVFPVDGEYQVKVSLRRQYADYILGMGWPQLLEFRLDGKLLKRFTVGGAAPGTPVPSTYAGDGLPGAVTDTRWHEYVQVTGDANLEVRVPVTAGPHTVGVSFVREFWKPEGLPQPLQREQVLAEDELYMGYAAVESVSIGGPAAKAGPAKDTPSRRAIFRCEPRSVSDEEKCATTILSRLARLAYRRPIESVDMQPLLEFFRTGRRQGGSFDRGIQLALERMLIDPDFLLRLYADRSDASGRPYRLTDVELASRLSFFLWNSIPDDRLLTLAEQGRLTNPTVLQQETRRMLADPRAIRNLVTDFAAQWLNLRRVRELLVDEEHYPHYDETLLHAFTEETELFVGSTLRENRSVTELLTANYTFVNERLARHYGIPGVYGSRFRRVTLPDLTQRGGLLANGALLATTSYPDRTSPVLRGKWLLDNIFGIPIPDPPPNVNTTLPEPEPGAAPPAIRERLAQHRTNAVCSTCHSVIDPIGFTLENFDAIGGWRTIDESRQPVDASGTTTGGQRLEGLTGLRGALLKDPEQFPRTLTEKLMAYALSRRLEAYDRPAVRRIVRDAAADHYRWSSIVLGIVNSPGFLMRASTASVQTP